MANIAILNYCNLKCPYCAPGDTEIYMADGTVKLIKDIVEGDEVFGFDEFLNPEDCLLPKKTIVKHTMSRITDSLYHITMEDGSSIYLTGNHPVLTSGYVWLKAEELKENMILYSLKDNCNILSFFTNRIVDIYEVHGSFQVYNFETDLHTYVANKLAIHNCFADDMIQEKSKSITIDELRRLLEFLSRTPNNHVGIIGGEPTLHPEFDKIIEEINKYCRELNTSATLFTNGIELEKYIPIIGERIGMLINCNNPLCMSKENYEKLTKTLDKLYELSWFDNRANCGCNVHPGCKDYSFIWEIVDKYHLTHLRCSVVSPGGCYHNMRSDKEAYYEQMKPIYMNFVRQAKEHNCHLNMDCGHIPACYFDESEMELLNEVCGGNICHQEFCNPVIDITPDFKATACFGSYDPVDIRSFNDLFELERYLLIKKTLPRVEANCTGKCTTCEKYKLLQCQGGCLGFAEV